MPQFERPDVYAREQESLEGPVQGTATGFGGMLAVTQKGPVKGVEVTTKSFEAWKRVFGGREVVARSDAAYEAKAFFDEGGLELITVRMCHYTDLDDPDTFTGGVANVDSSTEAVGATAASKELGVGPYAMVTGDSFDLDVDNAGVETPAFTGVAGYVEDTSVWPLTSQVGKTVTVSIAGGPVQTATLGAFTALDDIAVDLNQKLTGCQVWNNGGQLQIKSDIAGTSGTVSAPGGTSDIVWAAPTAPTGNVANILLVTTAEVKTIVEAATTATVALNGDGSCTISSPTTGVASELDFQTTFTALGIIIEVITGTASGATYPTLNLKSGYHGVESPGLNGNTLAKQITQNPLHPTQGAGNDLVADAAAAASSLQITSLDGLNEKSVIKIWDGTNIEYHEVLAVRSVVAAGVVTFWIDLVGTLTNTFTAVLTQIESREFDLVIYENNISVETKFVQMSTLDTADNYFVTLINDEFIGSEFVVATDLNPSPPGMGGDLPATDADKVALTGGTSEILSMVDADWIGTSTGGTGLYGFDSTREFMPFCTPGNNNASVYHAATNYAEARMFMEYIGFIDEGMAGLDAIAFRNNVIGINSSYSSLYAGGIKVFDPDGTGSNPRRSISGVGALMGLRSRVDSLPAPNGGPWEAPAGEGEYGTLKSALDVATVYNDDVSGSMNNAHINVIRKRGRLNPVTVNGSRSLDASVKQRFRYINTRRFFQYAEKSVIDSTRWSVHRNNDFRLWSKLRDAVDEWLEGLMPLGAFPTSVKELAYFVKCGINDGVMTAGDIDSGDVKGQIGIAPHKPGEFIIWDFSQFESGYDVVES